MAKISCIEEIAVFQNNHSKNTRTLSVHPLWQFCIYTESGADNSLEISPFGVLITRYRETTEKACSIMQWLQSWPMRKHDVSWFPAQLCIRVCLHGHLEPSQVNLRNTIILSLLQANKSGEALNSHLSSCNMTRPRRVDASNKFATRWRCTSPAHISASPALTDPFWPAFCFHTYSFFMRVPQRNCLWALFSSSKLKVFRFKRNYTWIKK